MNMRREVKFLYLLMLKKQSVVDLKTAYKFYNLYKKSHDLLIANTWIPGTDYLTRVKMPKYLEWAKQYIVKEKRI
jgi:hypothetical protein